MSRIKYNNVGEIMHCLRAQSQATIREISADLLHSPNTVCGIIHGESHELSFYITFMRYCLKETEWEIDLSEVSEIIDYAFSNNLPLIVGAYDHQQKNVVQQRFVMMKKTVK